MKEISPYDLKINPFEVFSGDWMLLTAGNKKDGYNTMTVSWGQLGALWGTPHGSKNWGRPVSTVFVRPHRYTNEFMQKEEYYTIALYPKSEKKALAYLGAKSGRDEDKVKKMGLEPVFVDDTTYINNAELVLVCKKLYQAPILEDGFIHQDIQETHYPEKDYHIMYIGLVEKVLVKESVESKFTK